MKKALGPAACCVLFGAAAFMLRADDTSAKPVKVLAAASPATGAVISGSSDAMQKPAVVVAPPPISATVDFSSGVDVPITTDDPEVIAAHTLALEEENRSHPEIEAEEVQEQKAVSEQHDWMLRGYHEQLRKNGLEATPAADADPYALPSSLKSGEGTDLAHDPLLADQSTTNPSASRPHARKALADSELTTSPSALLAPLALPPMLPPLSSSDNPSSPKHDYFGGTDSTPSDVDTAVTEPIGPVSSSTTSEGSSLDVPGLTAAEQGGLPTDVNLEDRLPDEPAGQEPPRQSENDFTLPVAPGNDIAAFYKKQAASLLPPNAPTFQPLTALTLPKPYEPQKITAKPMMDGLRNHVADPLDFLNR